MAYTKIPCRKFSFPCYFYTIFDQKIRIRKIRKGFIAEKFIKGFWKNKWIPLMLSLINLNLNAEKLYCERCLNN